MRRLFDNKTSGSWTTLCLLMGLLFSGMATAQSDVVQTRVKDFLRAMNDGVGNRVSITVNTPTARMPACHDPRPFLPGNTERSTGRLTVGVRCPGDQPETRYLQADVSVFGTYFVASRDVSSGELLTAGDIETRQGDITRNMDNQPTDMAGIVGQQARRRIQASTTIVDNMLKAPDVISRGDAVKVMARGEGFAITTRGEALDNAAQGQSVRVRTTNGKVLTGRPDGPGVVIVGN